MKIIVKNVRKVKEFLDIDTDLEQNLMENHEKKVKEFILKYQSMFESPHLEDFKKFYLETGLFFCWSIRIKGQTYYINELGLFSFEKAFWPIKQEEKVGFKNHLLIETEADDIFLKKCDVYIKKDGKDICIYKDAECRSYYGELAKRNKQEMQFTYKEKDELKRFEILKQMVSCNFDFKQEQILKIDFVYPYNDLLILLKDGRLYVEGKIYAKNVKSFLNLNSYNMIIIYQDNTIEYYKTSLLGGGAAIEEYDKVITWYGFFAGLKYDCLTIITGIGIPDQLLCFNYEGVTDIECKIFERVVEPNFLIIKKNEERIALSSDFYTYM